MRLKIALAAALLTTPAMADAVDSAMRLCAVIDGTGLASSPCEVSGWSGSVTATIDMTSSEARKACVQMADMMRKGGHTFSGRQWTLQIKSPYSGDKSIAYCNLPG